MFNIYPSEQWACDLYFIGDALAATCYMWALLKFKKCALFQFGLALYTTKLLEELFGNPTEANPWSFLIIAVLFIEIRFSLVNKLVNGYNNSK